MERKSLDRMHPSVSFFYIVYMLIITMCTLNPYLLIVSAFASAVIIVYMGGWKMLIKNVFLDIPVIIFTVGIQPIFMNSGSTVLYYVNNNAVCLENYIYGAVLALLLTTVFRWCVVMRYMFDSEKCMYIIGRLSPSLAMMFTMILRFIPLMRQRYRIIHEGQIGMGRYNTKKNISGVIEEIRHRIKEISILISWSLENSIETSNSMESRGYGLKGRTSYNRYILKKSDILEITIMTIMGVFILFCIFAGKFKIFYLPVIYIGNIGVLQIMALIIYVLLCIFPMTYSRK